MKKRLAMVVITAALILSAGQVWAVIQGDVDGNGRIDLKDAILAMWNASGLSSTGVMAGADVNSDGVIGLSETLYVLKELTAINETRDTITDNSELGMSFVRIPAGTFTMGSPVDELGRFHNETQHLVTLTNDFYMMTTEVTQAQWRAVMGNNPSYFVICGGECPVEWVSWNDVQDFITELNAMDGRTYRLPTEAEWEYAARAGTTTAFFNGEITHTGDEPLDPNLNAIGWYWNNSNVPYLPNLSGKGTHPVAQKQPNAWGLYDMSGNVWEWCQDWFEFSYPADAVTNPTGPSTGSTRVVRGGSWYSYAELCRSAFRYSFYPTEGRDDFELPPIVGFRLAFSPGR